MQGATTGSQVNIAGLRSDDFLKWINENVDDTMHKAKERFLPRNLVDRFMNWAKRNSPWPLHWGIMCCAIEMAATSDPRFDAERFGIIYRSTPRQTDILLLNGPISLKLRPIVLRLYEQMPDPKWVIAMGECTICGGPYYDSYSIIKGSYTIVPTDVFIPGCPVRPEALLDGFLKLRKKIQAEKRGYIATRTGRLVSSREGQLRQWDQGEMTYEVPQVQDPKIKG